MYKNLILYWYFLINHERTYCAAFLKQGVTLKRNIILQRTKIMDILTLRILNITNKELYNNFYNPLEQFDAMPISEGLINNFIGKLAFFNIGDIYWFLNPIPLTFIGLYIFLILCKYIYHFIYSTGLMLLQYIFDELYEIVYDSTEPLYLTKKTWVTFIAFIFLSIFCKNLYSQLPAVKAVTATIQLPFSYSITIFVGVNFLLIMHYTHLRFLGMFVIRAAPMVLVPFLWIVELISHLIKVVSLAVRLCANIFSGHVLLDIIFTGVFLLIMHGGMPALIFITAQLLAFAIIILETFIGFLQAFVFINLAAIYLGDVVLCH